jgi:photosystem II stability/assembly factor-like uncharacterized protein
VFQSPSMHRLGVPAALALALATCLSLVAFAATSPPHVSRSSLASVIRPQSARTPITLTTLAMVSSSAGWGIGNGAVIETVDGGKQWTRVMALPKATRSYWYSFDLTATDANHVWVAETRAKTQPQMMVANAPASTTVRPALIVLSTDNGGQSWKHVSLRLEGRMETSTIGSIQFVNASVGWVMLFSYMNGGPFTIPDHALYRTLDGGLTWQRVEFNLGYRESHRDVSHCIFEPHVLFTNATQSWATGVLVGCVGHHMVYRSDDGGRTWKPISLPVPRSSLPSVCHCQPYFGTAGSVFTGKGGAVLGVLDRPLHVLLYRTGDGGRHWRGTETIAAHPGHIVPSPTVASFGAGRIWMLMNRRLYVTTNQGSNWRVIARLPSMTVDHMQFLSPNVGFAYQASVYHYLYKTTDGGRTWRRLGLRL